MSRDIKSLLKLAKLHNVEAIMDLGDLYFTGDGVEQDYKKAFDYYFRAAELGFAPAQYKLGLMYEEGGNIPQDGKKALRFYLSAAEQQVVDAQYHLATLFREGKLIKHDSAKAFFWYQKAAQTGHSLAEFYLGCMYLQGEGTAKDEKQAEELFLKSAEYLVESQRMLGQIYRNRNEIDESVGWYEKAAAAGDIESMFVMGLFYQLGPEEWRDLQRAANLFAGAARGQHAESRVRLESLAKTEEFARELLEKMIAEGLLKN